MGRLPAFGVRLNGGEFETLARSDGRFLFRQVPPGMHELTVVDALHAFPRVMVEIEADNLTPRFYDFPNPAQPTLRRELTGGLVMKPVGGEVDYFEKRQQMSVLSLLMNPMVLIMLFTLVVGFIMPKLMEGIDPAELAEYQKLQKQRGDPSNVLAGLLGGAKPQGEEEEEEEEGGEEKPA
jgi:hypothetical protein